MIENEAFLFAQSMVAHPLFHGADSVSDCYEELKIRRKAEASMSCEEALLLTVSDLIGRQVVKCSHSNSSRGGKERREVVGM